MPVSATDRTPAETESFIPDVVRRCNKLIMLPQRLVLFILLFSDITAQSCFTCSNSDSNEICNGAGVSYCDFDAGHVCQTKYSWRWNDLNVDKTCQTAIGACETNKQLSADSCSNPDPSGASTKCYYCCNTANCNEDPESVGDGADPEPHCRIGETNFYDQVCVIIRTETTKFDVSQEWCATNYGMDMFFPTVDYLSAELRILMNQFVELRSGKRGLAKVYIGLQYYESDDILIDVNTGNEIEYRDWAWGQPSRNGCVYFDYSKNGWVTSSCESSYPVVCSAPLRTVNGSWSAWSAWSECTQSCDGGITTRTRTCSDPAQAFGGEDCVGDDSETDTCNTEICVIAGNWAQWSNWGDCSVSCAGGDKSRSRTCTDPAPQNGGSDCEGDENSQSTDCNTSSCPIDGGWTSWTSWSVCTATCDTGTQFHSRACINPTPAFGGADCVGDNDAVRDCNTENCPVNGAWSVWQEWSSCSQSCDEGSRVRYRLCNNPTPNYGGLTCEGSESDTQTCLEDNCPVNGLWSVWTSWSTCSKTCDPGTQSRDRACDSPAPAYGGDSCAGDDSQQQDCITTSCPIDGNWGSWGTWSDCTETCAPGGTQIRYRNCSDPAPQHGGEYCAGSDFTTQACNSQACPVDGGWTDWSTWGSCSLTCGTGLSSRSRSCSDPYPSNGGIDCSGNATQTADCVENPTCPVNGNWATWSLWGDCSVTCGGGSQTRTRACTDPSPQNGGSECLGIGSEAETCNTETCPIHGGWASWTSWGSCSLTCGTGVMMRTRTCSNPYPSNGGDECAGSGDQSASCDGGLCAVDGGLTEWTEWSACSVSCEEGVITRSRTCTNPPAQNGGLDCLDHLSEDETCNEGACPVDGNWSDWHLWSTCSVSCGTGNRIRTKTCTNPAPQNNGTDCAGSGFETESCQEQEFCPIDGGFSDWGSWSACSVTCGDGLNLRTRLCDNPAPQYGGDDCSVLGNYNDTQACNLGECAVDGVWGEWSTFSNCTESCGGGTKERTRLCDNPAPAYGGALCGSVSSESTECNVFGCPVDGSWSEWSSYSSCSDTCGGGTQLRLRNCNNPAPENGGAFCQGISSESNVCNTNVCPDLNTAPYFNQTEYHVEIQEQLSQGVFVMQLVADDDDSGDNGQYSVSIVSGSNASNFQLDSSTGLITTAAVLDREEKSEYLFTIHAVDNAASPKTGTTQLQITIQDINDHDPVIQNKPYNGAVQEMATVGTRVLIISASDADYGVNSELVYSITDGNNEGKFAIDSSTGEMTLASRVDREVTSTYNLVVRVADSASTPKYDTTDVTVTVMDNNDNEPVFVESDFVFEVEEGMASGEIIGYVSATDDDLGENSEITYFMGTLLEGEEHFTITSNGSVILLSQPDREDIAVYVFTVRAFDNGPSPLSTTANVTVTVLDVNDNDPVFERNTYTAFTAENEAKNTVITQVIAADADIGINSQLIYQIVPSPDNIATQLLKISSSTGKISVKNIIDREEVSQLSFVVKAADGGLPQRTATASVTISITDNNDNSPILTPDFYNAEVPYDDSTGYEIATLSANDDDIGINGQFTYSWANLTKNFKINSNTGVVTVINGSSLTLGEPLILKAQARDKGSPQRTSSNQATIRVDIFNADAYLVYFELALPKTAIDAQITSFVESLAADLRGTYPTCKVKVYKTEEATDTTANNNRKKREASSLIWVYALSSNRTDDVTAVNIPKDYIPKEDLKFVVKDSTVSDDWPVISIGSAAEAQVDNEPATAKTPFASTESGIAIIVVVAVLAVVILAVVAFLVVRSNKQKAIRMRHGHGRGHMPPGLPHAMVNNAWAQEIGPRKFHMVDDALHKMNAPRHHRHPPPNMTGWEKVMFYKDQLARGSKVNPHGAAGYDGQKALEAGPRNGQLALPWHNTDDQDPAPADQGSETDMYIEAELAKMAGKGDRASSAGPVVTELDDFGDEIAIQEAGDQPAPLIELADDDPESTDTQQNLPNAKLSVIDADPDLDW